MFVTARMVSSKDLSRFILSLFGYEPSENRVSAGVALYWTQNPYLGDSGKVQKNASCTSGYPACKIVGILQLQFPE